MPRKKKSKANKINRPTKVHILEVAGSGLNQPQRRLVDQAEHLVVQMPYINDMIYLDLMQVQSRQVKPSTIDTIFGTTHRQILEALYKRKSKPTYFSGITQDDYQGLKATTIAKAREILLDAEDDFYENQLNSSIEKAQMAFQKIIDFKQGIEARVVEDIFRITEEISERGAYNITYVFQAENPQVTDTYTRFLNDIPEADCRTMQPFTLDFPTQLYRQFTRQKFINPDYQLNDIDYLRLVIHFILINLGTPLENIANNNFLLDQPWLNTARNKLINSFDRSDIDQLLSQSDEYWFHADKSYVFAQEFRSRLPKAKGAAQTLANKHLTSGFNLAVLTKEIPELKISENEEDLKIEKETES